MAYKAVIFDLDGTLVESLPGIASALNLALQEQGRNTYPTETIRTFIGDGSRTLCQRAIPDQPSEVIDSLEAGFKKYYAEEWKTGTLVFDGVHALFTACQEAGIRLAILSNKPHSFTVDIVRGLFPNTTFDEVMGQQEGITKKPAPDGTLLCIEKLNTSASDTVFVGDSTIDIETAKAAGTPSIAVTWGYHDQPQLIASGANAIADTMQQLTQLITQS